MLKDTMPYKEITVKDLHIKMYVPNDHVVKGVDSGWEAGTLRVWVDELSKLRYNSVLDVGAYTGIYTLLALAADKQVKAMEPLPQVFARLEDNIRLNGVDPWDITYNIGLSDTTANTIIHVTGNNPLPSGSSVDAHPHKRTLAEVPINLLPLDELMPVDDGFFPYHIGLIKMDVERHEMAALRGMKDILTTYTPTLIIELLTVEEAQEVFEFMKGIGYDGFYQIDDDSTEALPYVPVTEELVITPRTTNFLIRLDGL